MPRNRPQPAKAIIVARGLQLKDVAAEVEVAPRTFYYLMSGAIAPWPGIVEKLSDYLGVPPGECFHDDKSLADAARVLVEKTRRAQGLPATVTDVAVLERVASIVATSHKGTSATAPDAA